MSAPMMSSASVPNGPRQSSAPTSEASSNKAVESLTFSGQGEPSAWGTKCTTEVDQDSAGRWRWHCYSCMALETGFIAEHFAIDAANEHDDVCPGWPDPDLVVEGKAAARGDQT